MPAFGGGKKKASARLGRKLFYPSGELENEVGGNFLLTNRTESKRVA